MEGRQTTPRRWLIVNSPADSTLWAAVRHLAPRSGVLVLHSLKTGERRRLHNIAALRGLRIIESPRDAARIHNLRDLTMASLRSPRLILISPIHPTSSHPDWKPLPRMRAAALARLANRRAIALGGMDERRYAKVARLGFSGWAGISAFRI